MKKVLFGITNLSFGGAERVLIDVANRLSNDYEITIFTIYGKGELESQLSSKVILKSLYDKSYLELSKFQKHVMVPLKILLLKRRIYHKNIQGNYDREIAFLEGPMTRLMSIKNKATKKIAWIHNDMNLVFGQGVKAKIKKRIDKNVYEKYEKLVFVSHDNLMKFQQLYPNLNNEKMVIYNYIDKEKVMEKAKQEPSENFANEDINFVTVARLVEQKAIDRLLRVHKRLLDEGLQHHIYVVGEGHLRKQLEEQIQEKEVKQTFCLLGKKENPYSYIEKADYFCLLSYFEGYPMVLLEAKILGKPIIITDTAARETVENYENATILKNSDEAIYEGLKEIIKRGKRNRTKIQGDYHNEESIEKIIKLLD